MMQWCICRNHRFCDFFAGKPNEMEFFRLYRGQRIFKDYYFILENISKLRALHFNAVTDKNISQMFMETGNFINLFFITKVANLYE
jgi:hypothetical protein